MKTIYVNAKKPIKLEHPITACIGYFDGLHKGHQALINKVLEIAKQDYTIPALISFDPDPWTVIRKIENPPHILAMDDRKNIMQEMGIQLCIILEFDQTMAAFGVEEFHEKILRSLCVKTIVCGFDFHYGKQGSGSMKTLLAQSYFQVEMIDKVTDHHEKISSSRIERLLTHGRMEEAQRLLTRPYMVSGTIVKGSQMGRTYGFPTANLNMDYPYVCPKRGVYIGAVEWREKRYPAIINIGNNPTFNYQRNISIEAHILDFHNDLYGEKCRFYFYKHLRDESKFSSKEALIKQLENDKRSAIAYFKEKRSI